MSILIDNFHTLIDSPEKINIIKTFFIDLAIRGELKTQKENDKAASVLLKEISKIKKPSLKNKINNDLKLFNIPNNWEWARLGDLIVLGDNLNIHKKLNPETIINYVDINAIDNKKYRIKENDIKIEKVHVLSSRARRVLEKGQILYSLVRPYLNNISIITENRDNFIGSTGLVVFKTLIETKYVFYYLLSSIIRDYYLDLLKGFNSPSITQNHFLNTYIPVPPLNEQKRIVDKLDFLFTKLDIFCNHLEDLQHSKNRLNVTLIQNLQVAKNDEEIKNIINILVKNFNEIFDTSQSVILLKDTILDLAVKGKLLSQNKNDETADVLFKKIVTEKKRINEEYNFKRKLDPKPISNSDLDFTLPKGWIGCKLDQISENIHYGYTASANFEKNDIRLLRITDIQNNRVNWNTVPGCDLEIEDTNNYVLNENDILIARTGGTIGKTFIVKDLPVKAIFASYLIRVIPIKIINADYIKLFLESPFYWDQLLDKSKGTGQPNVNATNLKKLIVTLPPLSEQNRIVKRVKQIFEIVDRLEESILQTGKYNEDLLISVLKSYITSDIDSSLKNKISTKQETLESFNEPIKNKTGK